MRLATATVILLIVNASAVAADDAPFPRVPPTEPAQAEATFRCLEGFSMQLLAAEPLVTDPVAMAYDEDGRAYVCEMNDYPYTDAATHQAWKENTTDAPIGKVRLLVDDDGDGRFDRSTVFADRLSWPTGIACYKGGVFVCATPDVWYFKDTNADGVADVRRKVFTGFRKYNVQAVMNNLVWGPDNKLYGAGGSNGGKVRPGEDCESSFDPLTLARNDFRFDPATEKFELIPGGARFGNTFDDYGNRFICNIRNPCQHVVIDDLHYLTRNPYATIPSVVHDVARSGDALPVFRISPVEAWRDVRANRFVKEQTKQPRSELTAGGVVTSASGVTVYRGDAYPKDFREMFVLGEVANNLIHRQRLRPDGVTFTSSRVDEKVEFVASTDVWFRPVNFVNAPDGTLHVLDMYREVIEHPWSIPDDIRARLDLRSGADRGRIYRLAPPGFGTPKPPRPPKLSRSTTAELVAMLASPNAWHCETAQRLLVERRDTSAIEPLRKLLGTSKEPLARLHALWTLQGLKAATEADVLAGLSDESAGVSAGAIRVAERHLAGSDAVVNAVLRTARGPDKRAQFQATLTLGEVKEHGTVDVAFGQAVDRNAGDPWLKAAVISAPPARAAGVLERLLAQESYNAPKEKLDVIRRLAVVVGARGEAAELDRVAGLILQWKQTVVRLTVMAGLGEGLRRRGQTLHRVNRPSLNTAMDEVARIAAVPGSALEERELAVRVLGYDGLSRNRSLFVRLLDPKEPPALQRAAVAALSANNAPEVAPALLSQWRAYTPAVKADVMAALLAYPNRAPALLDAVESGKVSPRDIPPARRPALLNHVDAKVKDRAAKLLGAADAQPKAQVLARFAAALTLRGDAAAGRAVFESACATCHKLDDKGSDVGPNLATVRQWSPEQLLTNILDPNREVAPAFEQYVVQLDDGETLAGVVAEETGNSITLKLPGGAARGLPRQSVKRIAASKVSLMPEGLEEGITPQQMADLIALLRAVP